jgi:hypothetical protein
VGIATERQIRTWGDSLPHCDCEELKREIEELRMEIATLRGEASDLADQLKARFRLKPQQSRVFARLLATPGCVVKSSDLIAIARQGASSPLKTHPSVFLAMIMLGIKNGLTDAGFNPSVRSSYAKGYIISKDDADAITDAL